MIISRKEFIGPLQQVFCGFLVINLSKVVELLGLLIANKLSWDHHIEKLSKSFSAQLAMLRKGFCPVSHTVCQFGRAALILYLMTLRNYVISRQHELSTIFLTTNIWIIKFSAQQNGTI